MAMTWSIPARRSMRCSGRWRMQGRSRRPSEDVPIPHSNYGYHCYYIQQIATLTGTIMINRQFFAHPSFRQTRMEELGN